MALNIYFALYKRYSLADLKSLELRYFVACYGVPLIPSITLLRVKTNNGGRIYGPATVWNGTQPSTVVFAHPSYRFGAQLMISGYIYGLFVSTDQSGMSSYPQIYD